MALDKETQEKLQKLQIAEQNLQNFSLQKQAFQLELNEADSALKETEKSSQDIYKITGQIMIKAQKSELLKELKEKISILKLRVKSIEKQEKILRDNTEDTKKELEKTLRINKK